MVDHDMDNQSSAKAGLFDQRSKADVVLLVGSDRVPIF